MNRLHVRRCGIDEAGRGALAGPLVAAAVVLPCSIRKISQRAKFKVRDGKLLTAVQRKRVYTILKRLKAEVSIEVICTRQINNRGIGRANREIMRRLVKAVEADEYILDGNLKIGRVKGKSNIRSVVDADATIQEVILAGIVAKVERDSLMYQLHRQFPQFGWNRNAGYGTKHHLLALQSLRPTRYHRNIFITTALRRQMLP